MLDTGPRTSAENLAMDDVLLTCRNKGTIPNTLRLLRYRPNSVLVGFHQSVEQEVRIEYCKENGIDINRRITGGGTIFFDEPQLGWELVASRDHPKLSGSVEELYERICDAAVKGLGRLGVDAAFRPKNDIEVDGRKISGTGGALEDSAFLFQGTLLTDFDVGTMLRALRIPIEKLKDKELESVKERVTCLKWELGYLPELSVIKKALVEGFSEVFGVEFVERDLTFEEKELLEKKLEYYGSDDWIYGIRRPMEHRYELMSIYKAPGGLIRTSLIADIPNRRIQAALITGDFFAYPKRAIFDLEALLKDSSMDAAAIEEKVTGFLDGDDVEIPGVTARHLTDAILKAVRKTDLLEFGIPLGHVNSVFTVIEPIKNLAKPTVLLLPYCAKLPECEYRKKDDCTMCGDCTISDAYELAREMDVRPITIVSFEDLMENLEALKEEGVKAYVGSCCEAFYVKHIEDFEKAGLGGILVDIDNETCYELGKEQEAYLGDFESQTNLKNELIRTVLKSLLSRD